MSVNIFGIDYAWGRPSLDSMKSAGVKFVCRYLSHTAGKNLTRAEAKKLSDAGIWIVVVWESTANRVLGGYNAGILDAQNAHTQAIACGMPDNRPIYFAVDFDAEYKQQAAINNYLLGVASVIGTARTGLYAGYGPVKRSFDAKKIMWAWQTYAWSGGQWDQRAHIQQYSNDHTIGGVGCDFNHAIKDDYGQWQIGESPAKVDEMELNTRVKVDKYWLDKKQLSRSDYPVEHFLVGSLVDTRVFGRAILAKLDAQAAIIDKLVDAISLAAPELEVLKQEIRDVLSSIDIDIVVKDTDTK